IDQQGEIFVNETAPRVHNSGHHTIEANFSSQFDMLWRVILNYPAGNTQQILPAAIVNLVGEDGYSGAAAYQGLEEVLQMDNAFVHIYGKKETRPGRKMGHVTILGKSAADLVYSANRVKEKLKVVSTAGKTIE
ncbi:MAG TPA: ATP-grasp domain-containing protein, partial [Flavitalea sp.]|nr:ATP-grasp domain-containing protein [Flavitalea sp.]